MKTKIFELIDRKIDCCTYHVKDDGSEMSYGMRVLGELRSEIEKMEEWIPVTERLPENGKYVIGTYLNSYGKSRVIRCYYTQKGITEAGEDPYDFGEYDEERDEYYIPEGWYECNETDEINYKTEGEVTHWQPIPLPPNPSSHDNN